MRGKTGLNELKGNFGVIRSIIKSKGISKIGILHFIMN